MQIAYQQTTDFEVTARVRERYLSEINALKRIGFEEQCFYTEMLSPFSLLLFLPSFLLMRAHREVMHIRDPLRIAASYPLLIHRDSATYALIMGMGIKFYTQFIDGTGVITTSFPTQAIHDPIGQLYKYSGPASIELAWQSHQDQIGKLTAAGKQFAPQLNFEGYVEISKQEEGLR